MNFSVGTGFRFRRSGLDDAFRQIQAFRLSLAPSVQAARLGALADIAARIIDDRHLRARARAPRVAPFHAAMVELLDRSWAVETEQRHDPSVDFRCNVGLFPYEGTVYGVLHAEQPRFQSLWMTEANVEDFSYDASVSRPPVGPEEWAVRARVWRALYTTDDGPAWPALRGVVAYCVGPWVDRPRPEQVVAHLPTLAVRARRAAESAVLARWIKEQTPARGAARQTTASRRTRAQDGHAWLGTPAGAAAVDEEAAQILPRLPASLALTDLMGRARV